ncbi:MAG: hypothetical protein AAF958_13095 [Planctomycetota bacterium]
MNRINNRRGKENSTDPKAAYRLGCPPQTPKTSPNQSTALQSCHPAARRYRLPVLLVAVAIAVTVTASAQEATTRSAQELGGSEKSGPQDSALPDTDSALTDTDSALTDTAPAKTKDSSPKDSSVKDLGPKPTRSTDNQSQQDLQRIQRALEGKDVPASGTMIDDVLSVIRRNGSVVDELRLPGDSELQFQPAPKNTQAPPNDNQAASTAISDQKADAAESLLRAARLLRAAGPPSAETADLVNRMRKAAVNLLSE